MSIFRPKAISLSFLCLIAWTGAVTDVASAEVQDPAHCVVRALQLNPDPFRVGETITYIDYRDRRKTGKIERIGNNVITLEGDFRLRLPSTEIPLARAVKQVQELGGFKVGETVTYVDYQGNRKTGKIERIDNDNVVVLEGDFRLRLPSTEIPLARAVKQVQELGGFKVGETVTYVDYQGNRKTGKIERIDNDNVVVLEGDFRFRLPSIEIPLARAVKQVQELGGFKVGETVTYLDNQGNRKTGKIERIDNDNVVVLEGDFRYRLPSTEVPLYRVSKP
jgi:hypothetical protein